MQEMNFLLESVLCSSTCLDILLVTWIDKWIDPCDLSTIWNCIVVSIIILMFCQLYVIGVFVSQGFLEVLIRTRHPIIRIVNLLGCEEVVFTSVIQIREVCDNPLNSYVLKTHKINLIPKFSLSRNLREIMKIFYRSSTNYLWNSTLVRNLIECWECENYTVVLCEIL